MNAASAIRPAFFSILLLVVSTSWGEIVSYSDKGLAASYEGLSFSAGTYPSATYKDSVNVTHSTVWLTDADCPTSLTSLAAGLGDTEEKYAKQLDEKVLKKDAFSCVMIHGVGVGSKDPGEGWNPIPSLEIYESLFKLVAERKDKIYVDTYGNNNAYASRAGKAKLKKSGENEFMLEWTGKDQPADSQIWLRVAPEESVTVNGTPAKPNEFGGLLVRFGDKISVASKEG